MQPSGRAFFRLNTGRSYLCKFLSRFCSRFWVRLVLIGTFISLQSAYLLSFQFTFSAGGFVGDKQSFRGVVSNMAEGPIKSVKHHPSSVLTPVKGSLKLPAPPMPYAGHTNRTIANATKAKVLEVRYESVYNKFNMALPLTSTLSTLLPLSPTTKTLKNKQLKEEEQEEQEDQKEEQKEEDTIKKLSVKAQGRVYKKRPILGPTLDVNPNTSIPEFLRLYEEYCEEAFLPFAREDDFLPPCECVSGDLLGKLKLNFNGPALSVLDAEHPELELGGHWMPTDCVPLHKVAIIVPYRDREPHLRAFLQHMHPLLQRQLLDYRIFIVEQVAPRVFNKAMMMNIGFTEAKKIDTFDCFIFHDVDVLAEDDRNFYTCAHQPRHVGAFLRRFDYKLKYPEIFGAATAFTAQQFETVNGFSNEFFGWGGEDDDIARRVDTKGFERIRFPQKIARYTMINHKRDASNPYNKQGKRGSRYRPRHYAINGLSNLQYNLTSLSYNRLFTHIKAGVKPPKGVLRLSNNWPEWKGELDESVNLKVAG